MDRLEKGVMFSLPVVAKDDRPRGLRVLDAARAHLDRKIDRDLVE